MDVHTTTLPIEVYCNPTATFSANSVCFDAQSMTFIDNSINGTGNINSWNWNFGDGNGTSTDQNPQYTYDSCGIYDVQLIVTDNYSCSNTVTLPVEIYCEPTADFNYVAECVVEKNTIFIDNSTPNNIIDGYGIWVETVTTKVDPVIYHKTRVPT